MPLPSAVYLVKYAGTVLPGYCQAEDIPLPLRVAQNNILGRDGGTARVGGAGLRQFTIRMRVLSRLSLASTGLQHLNDCKEQYRSALATLARVESGSPLYIGETDRYIECLPSNVSAPQEAADSRRITYSITFDSAKPYFIGSTVSSSTAVSGNGTLTLSIGDTRKTYPVITVPSGITRITLSHSNTGKSFTLSGSHASPIEVDCGSLQITSAGSNAISYLTSGPNFGIYHVGSGTLTLSSSNVTGSGDVVIEMTPRYER